MIARFRQESQRLDQDDLESCIEPQLDVTILAKWETDKLFALVDGLLLEANIEDARIKLLAE